MSTGGDPSGRTPGREQEAENERTFADVLNAFSFDSTRRRRRAPDARGPAENAAQHDQQAAPPPPADAPFSQAPDVHERPMAGETDDAAASFVRAYAWTGGRTRARRDFQLETLVSTAGSHIGSGTVTQSDRMVLTLCGKPRSVAEVAAMLAVPLGVAKVLLGDMADRGLIVVHEPATAVGDAPDVALMERMLIGLRRL